MGKIFLVMFLVLIVGFSGIADAQLKRPRVTPIEGQSLEQQEKDIHECHLAAVKETGVNPDSLAMQIQMLESQSARDARPLPGKMDSLTLPPSRDSRVQKNKQQIKDLKKENEKYLEAFSREMKARGYEVK